MAQSRDVDTTGGSLARRSSVSSLAKINWRMGVNGTRMFSRRLTQPCRVEGDGDHARLRTRTFPFRIYDCDGAYIAVVCFLLERIRLLAMMAGIRTQLSAVAEQAPGRRHQRGAEAHS